MSKKRLFPKLEGTQLENFETLDSVDSLQATDVKLGDGDEAKPHATVRVHYTGALAATGVIFQSSHDSSPISFGLDQVIEGWREGVPGMKVGGIRRLSIPSEMAYGSHSPAKNIPANSDLVFDIELLGVLS